MARCQKIEYFSIEILAHLYCSHGASRSLLKVTTPTPAHPLHHNRIHIHTQTHIMVVLLFFMESKFLDNNNGYCLRACVRKHLRSKFGLVWVGVRVDAQSINDDDGESGKPTTTMTTTIPQSIDSWWLRKRVGVGEEGLRSLLRDLLSELWRGGGEWRWDDGGRAVGVSWHDVPTLFQDHRSTKKTTTDCARRKWNIIYIYIYTRPF